MTWIRRHLENLGHVAMLAMLANIVLAIVCCAAPAGGSASPFASALLCTADGPSPANAAPESPSPANAHHQCDCLAGCMAALAAIVALISLMLGARLAPLQPLAPPFRPSARWLHQPQWGRAPPLFVR